MLKITKSQLTKIIKEEVEDLKLGNSRLTKSAHAKGERERAKNIDSDEIMVGMDPKERGIIQDVENILTQVAEAEDLNKYKQALQSLLARIRKDASKSTQSEEEGNP